MSKLLLLGAGGPIVGGGGGGSFTTMDPADKHADIILSNGNLSVDSAQVDSWRAGRSVASFAGGKYHIEVTADQLNHTAGLIAGIVRTSSANFAHPGNDASGLGFQVNNFFYVNNAMYDADNPGTFNALDVLVFEIDDDNGTMDVAINTGSYVRADYPAGITAGAGQTKKFSIGLYSINNAVTVNFGDSAWVKTPTSGFTGLA